MSAQQLSLLEPTHVNQVELQKAKHTRRVRVVLHKLYESTGAAKALNTKSQNPNTYMFEVSQGSTAAMRSGGGSSASLRGTPRCRQAPSRICIAFSMPSEGFWGGCLRFRVYKGLGLRAFGACLRMYGDNYGLSRQGFGSGQGLFSNRRFRDMWRL